MSMRFIGELLRPIRPGIDALTSARFEHVTGLSLKLASPVFKEGEPLPRMCTADGDGRFPGLSWSGLPPQTRSVVVLVEDADIPSVRPATHLIVHSIAPEITELPPGAVGKRPMAASGAGWALGRNALGARSWLPPAPPPGHGPHRYAFQVFALSAEPRFRFAPSRPTLLRRLRPYLIAQGRLIGTYKRP